MNSTAVSNSLNKVHPICVTRGKNSEVWDASGNRYIDFIGGIGVLNLGHCHPEVVRTVCEQTEKLMHSAFNALPHQGYFTLAERLQSFVPVDYPLVSMLTNSGGEAADNALKIARAATGRTAVIAFDDGFHGRTLSTLNLNGKVKPYKSSLGALPGPVYHVPFPSKDNGVSADEALKCLKRLFEIEVDPVAVAALFLEPVQGEGGFRKLDPDFVQPLMGLCREHGILLVVDEIQSGFGRTGKPFAFDQLELVPDLLLMGKSMAAGLPLAAVSGRESVMNALPKGGLGGTYSGNAIAC
ncbi:MAG: aminotransferase class III-fold pyridoxal phosphate-dependent enzyme, partial [Natronospirillum sp.]